MRTEYEQCFMLERALDPRAWGTLAMMLGDYMIHSKMIPGRQQTVANTGNQEGQCWQLCHCPSLLNGSSLFMQKCRHTQNHSSSELGRIFAVKFLTSSAYLAPEETTSQICQKIEIFNFRKKCFDFFYLKCFALLS